MIRFAGQKAAAILRPPCLSRLVRGDEHLFLDSEFMLLQFRNRRAVGHRALQLRSDLPIESSVLCLKRGKMRILHGGNLQGWVDGTRD